MVERTMAFKHYDVVRAASPSDLAEKLTHKLKEGWQPFGSPVAITPYTLMARRQHCRKTRKTFCWRYAGCRGNSI
ncbi:DUF1737 domain-containing protein [Escherichia coli]|uniref:DUF1737 domain-containing protein n=1 Tax=Escherichia coli TaxID=562 RepID=UPI003D369841